MTDTPADADTSDDGADDEQAGVADLQPVASSLRSAQHREREPDPTDDEQAEPEPTDSEMSSGAGEVDDRQPVATSLRAAQHRASADDGSDAHDSATDETAAGATDAEAHEDD